MCMKINYPTRKNAEHVAKDIKKRRRIECKPYYCEECDGWHLFSDYKKTTAKYSAHKNLKRKKRR